MSLTRCHFDGADLEIEWKVLKVHGTEENKRNPDGEEDVAVRFDPNQNIRHDDVVEMAGLFVREKQVWLPDLLMFGQSKESDASCHIIVN